MTNAPVTSNAPLSLYASEKKIYPREVEGRFAVLRNVSAIALLGVYYLLPWVQWHDRQAVLFELAARKFHIFGLTFLPQDFYLLTWLLIIAALSLFFFTALAGRLWCGYACPQTVWTSSFVWMERIAEGTRAQRMKLDKAPWSVEKAARKCAKQAMWITFAAWTGFTFVGYFSPIRTLATEIVGFTLGPWELFWIVFYASATYGNAGFLREQVCKYMCPYARFQGAMFDKHTLIISYDATRGEKRGSRARGVDARSIGLGDCIDCTLCVQACPTGIDIRKGLQYECIACAACIDACDGVMDKMGYARGLVGYATQAKVEGKSTRILRPRSVLYGLLLALLVAGFLFAVAHRNPVELDVLRDRNALYRWVDDGRIENVYTIRIINKDNAAHTFELSVSGIAGAEVDTDQRTYSVGPGAIVSVPVRIRAPADTPAGGHTISLGVLSTDAVALKAVTDARFFAPK